MKLYYDPKIKLNLEIKFWVDGRDPIVFDVSKECPADNEIIKYELEKVMKWVEQIPLKGEKIDYPYGDSE